MLWFIAVEDDRAIGAAHACLRGPDSAELAIVVAGYHTTQKADLRAIATPRDPRRRKMRPFDGSRPFYADGVEPVLRMGR